MAAIFLHIICGLVCLPLVTKAENSQRQNIRRAASPGQTVLLPCSLTDTNVDWLYQPNTAHGYHNHGHQSITHNSVVTAEFGERFQIDADGMLIKDVRQTDEGTYTCVDHHHHQRQIRLFVPCENIYVHEGEPLTLDCQAMLHGVIIWRYTSPHHNDIHIIYWKDSIYHADRQRFKIHQPQTGIFDLVITRVMSSDAGIYRCRENDGRYPGEACTELVVIDTLLQHTATFVGETVHLQCGENKPSNDRVDWLYLPSPTAKAYHIISAGYLTNGNRGDRLSISGSTLVINNVENKDGGSYICVEDAGRGKKHSVFLTVKGPQSVAETTITAVTGNRVTLSCRTTLATPVDWYYLPSQNARGRILYSAGNIVNDHDKRFALDRSIQGEFSLIIVNVTREDEGLYICKEDAGLGMAHRVQLYVHEEEYRVGAYTEEILKTSTSVATFILAMLMGTVLLVALAIFLMAVLLSKFRHRYQRYKYKRKCRDELINRWFVEYVDKVYRKEMAKGVQETNGVFHPLLASVYQTGENRFEFYL